MGLSSLQPSDEGPLGDFLGLSLGIYVDYLGLIKSIIQIGM